MGITQVHPDYWRRWEEDIHWFHRMGGDEQLRNHYTFLILSFPLQEKQLPTMPMVISTKACSIMAFGKVLVCTRAPHPFSVGGHPSPQWKNQVLWCIWGLYIGIVTDSPPNSLITKQQKWDTFCVVGQVPEGRRVHRPLWEQSEDWPRPSHVRVCRLVFSAGLKRRADNQRRYKKGGYFHGHFKDGQRNGEVGKNSGKSVDGCGTCAFCPPRAHRAPSSMPMVISTQAASSRF